MRLFRIDNDAGEPVVFEGASIASTQFRVVPARYLRDPEEPNAWVRVTENFPVTRPAGGSLYFEVTFASGSVAGALPADHVRVSVQSTAVPGDVLVPIVGSSAACPASFGTCDSNPNNGCETNLAATATCGSCSNDCNRAFSTMTCDSGSCKVESCAAPHADCNDTAADGCETDTEQSLQHCGGCDKPCALAHAAESCVSGSCVLGQCESNFSDCNLVASDGCESNTLTDTANCGACQHSCASEFPGGLVSCSSGQCQLDGCSLGFVDLNSNPSDGCEYQCLATSATDLPDDGFVDANCDGVDGDASKAVFVAVDGSDGNPGTMLAPMLTVNAAIGRALSQGKEHVYLSQGTYTGRVTLANGISLYGGYSRQDSWRRSAAYTSKIMGVSAGGRASAVEGTNLTLPTVLDRLSIEAPAALIAQSSYAMYCSSCSGVTLKNSSLRAGSGGAGTAGVNGINGANGVSPAALGGSGSCDGSLVGSGSDGGQLFCGGVPVSGGRGGDGGAEGSNSGKIGIQGLNSGGSGGPPGSGGDPGRAGGPGQPGAPVSDGPNGNAGAGGAVVGGNWVGNTGASGGNAPHGRGGGGGGGGGGQGCFTCNDGTGNGGGGGGSGGCGGTGASGGSGGGASFGLLLVNSTGFALSNNVIASGNGGQGGIGGTGGAPGTGADGVSGGLTCTGEVGGGGKGGRGSAGGRGGHGGGGAGGPSFAVYRSNTTLPSASNNLQFGLAGAGGPSPGNSGIPGASGVLF
jgi:hypothetical protein